MSTSRTTNKHRTWWRKCTDERACLCTQMSGSNLIEGSGLEAVCCDKSAWICLLIKYKFWEGLRSAEKVLLEISCWLVSLCCVKKTELLSLLQPKQSWEPLNSSRYLIFWLDFENSMADLCLKLDNTRARLGCFSVIDRILF